MESSEKPKEYAKLDGFGEKDVYWARYDKLADGQDKVMLDRLNRNLDVLLIFVSAPAIDIIRSSD